MRSIGVYNHISFLIKPSVPYHNSHPPVWIKLGRLVEEKMQIMGDLGKLSCSKIPWAISIQPFLYNWTGPLGYYYMSTVPQPFQLLDPYCDFCQIFASLSPSLFHCNSQIQAENYHRPRISPGEQYLSRLLLSFGR